MTLTREINWLVDRIVEEYPYLEGSGREFIRNRLCWGIPKGFTYWWGDHRGPFGGIIIRPVTEELITRGYFDYWGTIYECDRSGDICWVDFAYGPGLYPKMIALCRTTGCARLGWRHRNRVHLVPMERMPAKGMKFAFHI